MDNNGKVNDNAVELDRAQACAAAYIEAGVSCGGCAWYSRCGIGKRDKNALSHLLDAIDPLGDNIDLLSLPHLGDAHEDAVMILATASHREAHAMGHVLTDFKRVEFDDPDDACYRHYTGECVVCGMNATLKFGMSTPQSYGLEGDAVFKWCPAPFYTWTYVTRGTRIDEEGGKVITLDFVDRNKYRDGRHYISYVLSVDREPIFAGNDFGASPIHSEDSIHAIMALLDFLTLHPDGGSGVEDDYWENYSVRQLDWLDSDEAEELRYLSLDFNYAQEGTGGNFLDDTDKLTLKLVVGAETLYMDAPDEYAEKLLNLGLIENESPEKNSYELVSTAVGRETWAYLVKAEGQDE